MALLTGASPALAGKPDLAVRSVSAARSATAGAPAAVAVGVARTGRTPAAGLRFYLSSDGRRDARDTRLGGKTRVGAGGRARSLRVFARPEIPAGQALRSYRLIACVDDPSHVREVNERNNCRAAKGSLTVTATPVGTRELVAAAVAAKRITPQQGLVYRVFAAFGDKRLPAAYAGDDVASEDTVMREVIDAWPTLSPAQRRAVQPFFTPPAAKGSWLARGASAVSAGIKPAPLVQPTCDTEKARKLDWRSAAKPGGHVRIWWLRSDEAQVGPEARHLVSEVENVMWPKLKAIMGREPLSDAGVPCFHGIDGKLDIYLARLDRGRGVTVPYPPACKATPAYIVFRVPSAPDRWELSHELMHAFQFAFRYRDACSSYSSWDEAIGNWAGQHVYPKDDGEHWFTSLLHDPDEPLNQASYGGWVFPYAMEQLHGAGTIGAIYRQTETHGVMQAVDAGVPGGLRQAWPEFSRLAWNQDPVSPSFREWDRLDEIPLHEGGPIGRETVESRSGPGAQLELPAGLQPLTRLYRDLKFAPEVNQLTIESPRSPDLHVDLVVRLRNGTTSTIDLSKRRVAVFCPQSAGEQLDEAVLVASNTSITQPLPASPPIRIMGSRIGCARYVGTISGSEVTHTQSINTTETWRATGVTFERTYVYQDDPSLHYRVAGGTVTWSFDGVNQGCTYKAGPVTLPVPTGDRDGFLNIPLWFTNGPTRRYSAVIGNLPAVQGTITCPTTGTHAQTFRPHTLIDTTMDSVGLLDVPADGVLAGSQNTDEHTGGARTLTTSWRFEPQP